MKIVDCNISREAQIALYKRGFSTVEKLRNPDINDALFKSLKYEPMNLVNEITKFISIIQSGKTLNSIKGKSIAYKAGLDYPKNVYDSMIRVLQKNNHPALNKLPFTDNECTANVLKIIDSLIRSSNGVLSDDDRKLLIFRYLLLYTTKDTVKEFGIIVDKVDKQDRSFDKRLKVVFDKIAKRLCFMYGSEDIEDMGISPEAEDVLYRAGIKTKTDLLQSDLPSVLACKTHMVIDKSVLNEISAFVKKISCGNKTVDFSVLDPNRGYPYNIFLDGLKFGLFASSDEKDFHKIIDTFLSDECKVLNEQYKLFLCKKYKELKDANTIGEEVHKSWVFVLSKIRRAVLMICMSMRKLYHYEDSIFKLNIDDDMKKSLLNKGICTVPEDSIFDSDLSKDELWSLMNMGILQITVIR